MEEFKTTLKAEFHPADTFSWEPRLVVIRGNSKGLFVNSRPVTDIFFNFIQLRLYLSGNHKRNNYASVNKDDYYVIFDKNENDLGLPFEDLNSKLETPFGC